MSTRVDSRNWSTVILPAEDGCVEVEELGAGKRRITAYSRGGLAQAYGSCVTAYPIPLLRSIVGVKGAAWTCDEVTRDEDPESIQRFFEKDFLPYIAPSEFEGRRILDFGCGSGSSTMVLARMFPRSEIVGIELSPEYLEIAEQRKAFYGCTNVRFVRSPSGTTLPEGLGEFDFVVMSAVYEHLLPAERRNLMPQLWAKLKRGGRLLLNQTPHRFFPFESHTTGLPFINYLPDRLAHFVARRFSRRDLASDSWESLLRKGIRGATEREILSSFGSSETESAPSIVPPQKPLYRDRVDVWYQALGPRHRALKTACRELLRVGERVLGTTLIVNLALVIGKGTSLGRGEAACPAP